MGLIESPKKELAPEEKISKIERDISVEIEKKIIGKYATSLMAKGLSKIEAQSEWIRLNGEKYRNFFNKHKDEIIKMNLEDQDKTIDYIEEQLESGAA